MSAKEDFHFTYGAARAGRAYFEMPFFSEAIIIHHEHAKNARIRLACRWLSHSIPQLVHGDGIKPVDVARWLIPARARFYAAAAGRRFNAAKTDLPAAATRTNPCRPEDNH